MTEPLVQVDSLRLPSLVYRTSPVVLQRATPFGFTQGDIGESREIARQTVEFVKEHLQE